MKLAVVDLAKCLSMILINLNALLFKINLTYPFIKGPLAW